MSLGIVNQALAALRREPLERSEMVNQLLFGETFAIDEQYKGWARITLAHDSYSGWVDSKMIRPLSPDWLLQFEGQGLKHIATKLFVAQRQGDSFPMNICPGSVLYGSNGSSFQLPHGLYQTSDNPLGADAGLPLPELVVRRAHSFVNSPYLWGGRSPFGVDCSGLVQVVFRTLGINLPRDAAQQIAVGQTIDFLNLAQPGDLAFFDNDEGHIIHVGILIGNGQILHSSGYVRVDRIDQQGIFSLDEQQYSHKLRLVKRVV